MFAKTERRKIDIVRVLAVIGCCVLQAAGVYLASNWVFATIREIPLEVWLRVAAVVSVIVGMAIVLTAEITCLAKARTPGKHEKQQ